MKKRHVMQGVCPKCGSENLEYETMELDIIGDSVYYHLYVKPVVS